jgi:glutamate-5-semialdehyde dehydrogenase
MNTTEKIARQARAAALELAGLDLATKNAALEEVRRAIERHRDAIFEANREDRREAAALVESGKLSSALAKRLDIEGEHGDARRASKRQRHRALARRSAARLRRSRASPRGLPVRNAGRIFGARPEAAVGSPLAIGWPRHRIC